MDTAKEFHRYSISTRDFEKALQSNPDKTEWLEDLAVAYGFTKQYAKTIPLLEKVIHTNPYYANAYMNISASYNFLGNKENAEYYQKQFDNYKSLLSKLQAKFDNKLLQKNTEIKELTNESKKLQREGKYILQ